MAGWSGRENEMQAHTPPREGGMNNGNQEAAKVGGGKLAGGAA